MVDVKIRLVNWRLQLVMMSAGTPKHGIYSFRDVSVMVEASILAIGTASSHLVYLSAIVNRYMRTLDDGRGLTRSRFVVLKRLEGVGNIDGGEQRCF